MANRNRVTVALVAVMSLSVAAFAQGPQPPAGVPQGYDPGMGRGMRGAGGAQAQMPVAGYGFRFGINGRSLVDVTAQVTGLKVEGVVKELQTGKTFADVAKSHGKTAADVVSAFLADRKSTLDKTLTDGRFTGQQPQGLGPR